MVPAHRASGQASVSRMVANSAQSGLRRPRRPPLPLSRSHPSSSPASIATALSSPRSDAGQASTRRQRRPSGLSAQPGGCAEIRRRVFRTSREMSVRGSGCGYRGWRRAGRGLRDAPVSVDPQRGAGVGKMGAFYSPFANRRTGNALVELGQCCGGVGHRPPRTPDSQDTRGDAHRSKLLASADRSGVRVIYSVIKRTRQSRRLRKTAQPSSTLTS